MGSIINASIDSHHHHSTSINSIRTTSITSQHLLTHQPKCHQRPQTRSPPPRHQLHPKLERRPVRPERRRREQRRARRPTLHTFTKSSSKSTQTLVSPTAPCQF